MQSIDVFGLVLDNICVNEEKLQLVHEFLVYPFTKPNDEDSKERLKEFPAADSGFYMSDKDRLLFEIAH